jgi:hypothetical protein
MSLDTYIVTKTGNSVYEVSRYKAGDLLETTRVDLMKSAKNDYEIKRHVIARRYASEGCPNGTAYWFSETGAISRTKLGASQILEEGVTRRHLVAAAGAIRAMNDPRDRQRMANFQAKLFARDNPRFDHARFHAAAGTNYHESSVEEKLSKMDVATTANMIRSIQDPKQRQAMANLQAGLLAKDIPGFSHEDFHIAAGTVRHAAPQQYATGHTGKSNFAAAREKGKYSSGPEKKKKKE